MVSGYRDAARTAPGWRWCGVATREKWDAAVKARGGSVLQSWAWGEWYRRGGMAVERVRVDGPGGTGLAQVLIWPGGEVAEARLAWGPVISGDPAAVAPRVFAALDEVCAPYRPLTLTIDPPAGLWLEDLGVAGLGPTRERWCCNGRTIVVPLLDDEALLRRMRSKTRQQVRQPERRGVVVEQIAPGAAALAEFYALLEETARRNEFAIEPLAYYQSFVESLADEVVMTVARVGGALAAALIVTCFGDEAIAHFSGSSAQLRVPGATARMYFEAMRATRARGCSRFDLWGIPEWDPPSDPGDRPQASRGHDWQGIHHFKAGLGGDVVSYPPPLERRYPSVLR